MTGPSTPKNISPEEMAKRFEQATADFVKKVDGYKEIYRAKVKKILADIKQRKLEQVRGTLR